MLLLMMILIILVLVGTGVGIYFVSRNGTEWTEGTEDDQDCEVSRWGECSQTGIQVRSIINNVKGGGEECPKLSQTCEPLPIPDIDCITSDWGNCSPTTRTRDKNIITPKSGNGKDCGIISESCIPDIDCELSTWSNCKPLDSYDKYQSTRSIIVEKVGNGAECSTDRTKDCSIKKSYDLFTQYDYGGNDIKSMDNVTVDECETECNKYKDCVAFNHVKPSNTCWIKNAAKGGKVNNSVDVRVVKGTTTEGSYTTRKLDENLSGVKIKRKDGKCLQMLGSENFANAQFLECNNDSSQLWDYTKDKRQIKSQIRTGGNACLQMKGSGHSWTKPFLNTCDNSIEQKWNVDVEKKKIKRDSSDDNVGECVASNSGSSDYLFRWGCIEGDNAQEITMG